MDTFKTETGADQAEHNIPTDSNGRHRAAKAAKPKTLLVLSQVYVPDPAAVGQYMADVAEEMAGRGYKVVVLTANAGYDDPAVKYPRREVHRGVEIRRLPFSSFGKSSFAIRLLAAVSFIFHAGFRGLFIPRLGGVLVSTSPPLCVVAALAIRFVRRVPFVYWLMDLNPDQMVALGTVTKGSFLERVFTRVNQSAMRTADKLITLDHFMARRLQGELDFSHKLDIIPPWPHESYLEEVNQEANPFRIQHGLEGKRVLMYSGNHSASNPLDTILEALLEFRDEPDLRFLFVGGGLGKGMIEKFIDVHQLKNTVSLPYQDLSTLRYSLSAADVHMVSLGDALVGIIHPSKIYAAMFCGRPILFLGPESSHIGEILGAHDIGWRIAHQDVGGAVEVIRYIAGCDSDELEAKGNAARTLATRQYVQHRLCATLCDSLENVMAGAKTQSPAPQRTRERQAGR